MMLPHGRLLTRHRRRSRQARYQQRQGRTAMEENTVPPEPEQIQREKVKELFDDRAELYFREREEEHAFAIQKNCVLRMFDKDGGKVLDIGCGPAVMTDDLLLRGCTVWGIDVSQRMIDFALAKMERHDLRHNARFSVGDIENLEFQDGHFDAIICMGVLEYLLDDRPAIREMSRVLKPGGTAIITTPSEICTYQATGKCVGLVSWIKRRVLGGQSEHTPQYSRTPCIPWELDRKLRQEGIRKVDSAHCNAVLWPATRLLPDFPAGLTRRLEVLCKLKPLGWLGTQYIVKGRKV